MNELSRFRNVEVTWSVEGRNEPTRTTQTVLLDGYTMNAEGDFNSEDIRKILAIRFLSGSPESVRSIRLHVLKLAMVTTED